MSIHRKLMTACAAAVLAFGLAACGSSDDDDTPTAMMPMGTPVAFADLEMGQTVEAGTYAVSDPSVAFLAAIEDFELPEGGYAPGAMESVGGLDFTCAADSATNCNVVVNEDGSITTTGTIQVAMTPPPPTPIESATMAAVTAASEAATAAQTAADDAKTAYEAAATAAENRAWFQTMPRSSESRDMAKEAAMAAATSAADAKTAAEDAAAAEDVTAAIEARIKAETAQADAEVAKHGCRRCARRGPGAGPGRAQDRRQDQERRRQVHHGWHGDDYEDRWHRDQDLRLDRPTGRHGRRLSWGHVRGG